MRWQLVSNQKESMVPGTCKQVSAGLSDEQLGEFRKAYAATRDDNLVYNAIGKLNQAAWIGERANLLIDEIYRLRAEVAQLKRKSRRLAAALRRPGVAQRG